MLKSIDNLFKSFEGKKTVAKKLKTKRKKTPKSIVKNKLRKTATKANKTATKRVKTVINNLVKTTSASIDKTIKPARKGTGALNGVNNKGAVRLKAIVAKAKVIRKATPAKKWTKCVSEASKLV